MAHNIAVIDGVVSFAYQNATPWHGLGERVRSLTSIEQALAAGNMGWQVGEFPLALVDGTPVPSHKVIARLGRDGQLAAQLGVVGKDYTPSQNVDNLAIAQPLLDMGCTFETIGALGEGERCFALLKLPEATLTPVPGDDVRGYGLLDWSHDGQSGIRFRPTGVRVVCQNTLAIAMRDRSWVNVQHRSNVAARIDDAARLVAKTTEAMTLAGTTYAALARARMTRQQLAAFVAQVIPSEGAAKVSTVIENRRATIAQLAYTGKGADMASQLVDTRDGGLSLWAAVNAVSEYFDHVRPAEAGSAAVAAKANESAIFGGNADVKVQALTVARQLLGAAAVAA